jgi:hypothetical protein
VTRQDAPGATDDAEPVRPARPASVELAAAILIVGGILQLLSGIATLPSVPPGAEPFAGIALALDAASVTSGVLARTGRAWLVALNVAAILGFLDLLGSGGSPFLLMLGVAEVLVVGLLLARKPWFDAMSGWRAATAARARLSP